MAIPAGRSIDVAVPTSPSSDTAASTPGSGDTSSPSGLSSGGTSISRLAYGIFGRYRARTNASTPAPAMVNPYRKSRPIRSTQSAVLSGA